MLNLENEANLYQRDAVLISENEENLQQTVIKLAYTYEERGLK